MNVASLDALSEVTQEVLLATAFAFGDPCPATELPDCGSSLLRARLQFQGSVSGELHLTAPADLCAVLAADVLSEDADAIGRDESEDSLKELLNVIGGNWLTALYGDELVFALSAPRAETIGAAEWDQLRRDSSGVGLVIDERPLLVNLCLS